MNGSELGQVPPIPHGEERRGPATTFCAREAPVVIAAGTGSVRRIFTIALPSGLRLLNANKPLHYRRRAQITKELRSAAMAAVSENRSLQAALAEVTPAPLFLRAHVLGVLHPTTGGRRDPANWYPSFKAAVDGIVDAGVLEDDDHTRLVGPDMRIGAVVKGGQIVLRILELAPGEQWPDFGAGVAA